MSNPFPKIKEKKMIIELKSLAKKKGLLGNLIYKFRKEERDDITCEKIFILYKYISEFFEENYRDNDGERLEIYINGKKIKTIVSQIFTDVFILNLKEEAQDLIIKEVQKFKNETIKLSKNEQKNQNEELNAPEEKETLKTILDKFNENHKTNFLEQDIHSDEKGVFIKAYEINDDADTRCVDIDFDITNDLAEAKKVSDERIQEFFNNDGTYYNCEQEEAWFYITEHKLYLDKELGVFVDETEETETIREVRANKKEREYELVFSKINKTQQKEKEQEGR